MNKEQIHKGSTELNSETPDLSYGQSVWTFCRGLDRDLAYLLDSDSIFYITDGDVDQPELIDLFINKFLKEYNSKHKTLTNRITNSSGVVLIPIEDMFGGRNGTTPNLTNQRAAPRSDFDGGNPHWFRPAWDEERNTAVWYMIDDPDFIYDYCIPVFDHNWVIENIEINVD
jgi:hypothetical protein